MPGYEPSDTWRAVVENNSSRRSRKSEDDVDSCLKRWRFRCRRILHTHLFDTFIGLVIVVNCVTIGIDQSARLSNREDNVSSQELEMAENVFLTIYVIELGMRFFGDGLKCVKDHWVKFDCMLVASSLVFSWIFEFILHMDSSEGSGPLMVLRTIRLARLARTIRLLIKFRVLWMLVRGLLSSAETMFYTLAVLLIMLYVFATIGIELVTLRYPEDGGGVSPEFKAIIDNHFSTLPSTMLTIMQFACLDSIGSIYRPLILEDTWLSLYFLAIILIIPIVLMNLVTAVIVNSAFEQAGNDKQAMKLEEERKKAQLLKQARTMFVDLDEDGSNTVSREEMACIDPEQKELICEMCGMQDPLSFFDTLDIDGSGEIDIDEFCDGLWRTVTSKAPMEMQRMEKQIRVICDRQREADRRHDDILLSLTAMQRSLQRLEEAQGCFERPRPPARSDAKSCMSLSPLDYLDVPAPKPTLVRDATNGLDMQEVASALTEPPGGAARAISKASKASASRVSPRTMSKVSSISGKRMREENSRLRRQLMNTQAALHLAVGSPGPYAPSVAEAAHDAAHDYTLPESPVGRPGRVRFNGWEPLTEPPLQPQSRRVVL